ncbi:hypothetical protein EVAR_94782_1 [Eumeta japonica]|uniref:Uncharacterized protein n=1 Tax=Eumeta variegata TaxID=151549 RepID=A0A4C1UH85_EUMVA|nr:hypothetical protein EVAR_94782_1 [Eumeta japonica]
MTVSQEAAAVAGAAGRALPHARSAAGLSTLERGARTTRTRVSKQTRTIHQRQGPYTRFSANNRTRLIDGSGAATIPALEVRK